MSLEEHEHRRAGSLSPTARDAEQALKIVGLVALPLVWTENIKKENDLEPQHQGGQKSSDSAEMRQAYAKAAPLYDFVFGGLLQPGRRRAIQMMELRPGARVLEVGVGTGQSLALYPRGARVTGIDLSPDMLEKARARAQRYKLEHVEALLEMDATELKFPDDSFDVVIAMYIMSVADDPDRVLAEMCRVCRPGGRILIVNHFRSRSVWMKLWHILVRPVHRAVRFRSDLDYRPLLARAGLTVEQMCRANVCRYSTILCCRKPRQAPVAVGSSAA